MGMRSGFLHTTHSAEPVSAVYGQWWTSLVGEGTSFVPHGGQISLDCVAVVTPSPLSGLNGENVMVHREKGKNSGLTCNNSLHGSNSKSVSLALESRSCRTSGQGTEPLPVLPPLLLSANVLQKVRSFVVCHRYALWTFATLVLCSRHEYVFVFVYEINSLIHRQRNTEN